MADASAAAGGLPRQAEAVLLELQAPASPLDSSSNASSSSSALHNQQAPLPRRKQLNHHQLVQLLWAFGRLRFRAPAPLLSAMLQRIQARMPLLAASELTNVMWALAVLRFRPDHEWLKEFMRCTRTLLKADEWAAGGGVQESEAASSNTDGGSSSGRMHSVRDGSSSSSSSVGGAHLESSTSNRIVSGTSMRNSSRRLRSSSNEGAAAGSSNSSSSSSGNSSSSSVSRDGGTSGSSASAISIAGSSSRSGSSKCAKPSFSTPQVATLLASLAALHIVPAPKWQSALHASLRRLAPHLLPRQVGLVMSSLARLRQPPPPWCLDLLLNRVGELLGLQQVQQPQQQQPLSQQQQQQTQQRRWRGPRQPQEQQREQRVQAVAWQPSAPSKPPWPVTDADLGAIVWSLPLLAYPFSLNFRAKYRVLLHALAAAALPRLGRMALPQLVQLAVGFSHLDFDVGLQWIKSHENACAAYYPVMDKWNRARLRTAYRRMWMA